MLMGYILSICGKLLAWSEKRIRNVYSISQLPGQKIILAFLGSVIVGLSFSYIGKGIETSTQILTALATIQGSFLAIVVSVFLLTSQVTAGEFGPFVLDEIEDTYALDALILIYVSSILVDLLYIIRKENALVTVPTDLNLALGVPVGLAALCFLSLFPVKEVMMSSIDPENILKRTSENICWDSLGQSSLNEVRTGLSGDITRPDRTPLLVIEQIMHTAEGREDEITVRQSIYYMHLSLIKLIQNHSQSQIELNSSNIIFEHWQRCLRIGESGGRRRLILLGKTHANLIETLLTQGMTEATDDRLRELEEIQLTAFDSEYNEPMLLQIYLDFTRVALDSNATEEIESILSSLMSVGSDILPDSTNEASFQLSGEKRDLISTCVTNAVECLSIIGTHEKGTKKLLKRTSQNTIPKIDQLLSNLQHQLDELEVKGDAQGIEQNIFSDFRDSILSAVVSIYHVDHAVGKNLTEVAIVVSLSQNHSSEQFLADMSDRVSNKDSDESRDDEILDVFQSIIEELENGRYVAPLDSSTDIDQNEMLDFVSDVARKWKSRQ